MTIVAVWYEQSDDCLWCVADTRISKPGVVGTVVLTDAGSKIFSLKVKCAIVANERNPNRITYFDRDFGFAYAGNSLPALMTLSSANTLLQTLYSQDLKERVPSLEEIGWFVKKLVYRFSTEVWLANRSVASLFQSVLFGRCPRSGKLEIYRFDTETNGQNLSVMMRKQADDDEIVVLGSGRDQFFIELQKLKERGEINTRLAKHAIRSTIEFGPSAEVGGTISQAIAIRNEILLYHTYDPIVIGRPRVRRHFNGIYLDELGMIGPCTIGGIGMAG